MNFELVVRCSLIECQSRLLLQLIKRRITSHLSLSSTAAQMKFKFIRFVIRITAVNINLRPRTAWSFSDTKGFGQNYDCQRKQRFRLCGLNHVLTFDDRDDGRTSKPQTDFSQYVSCASTPLIETLGRIRGGFRQLFHTIALM